MSALLSVNILENFSFDCMTSTQKMSALLTFWITFYLTGIQTHCISKKKNTNKNQTLCQSFEGKHI